MQDCLFACRSHLVYRAAAYVSTAVRGGVSEVAIGKSAKVSGAVEVTVTSLNEQPVWLHGVGGSAPEGVEDLSGRSQRLGRRGATPPSAAGRKERAKQTHRDKARGQSAIYVNS